MHALRYIDVDRDRHTQLDTYSACQGRYETLQLYQRRGEIDARTEVQRETYRYTHLETHTHTCTHSACQGRYETRQLCINAGGEIDARTEVHTQRQRERTHTHIRLETHTHTHILCKVCVRLCSCVSTPGGEIDARTEVHTESERERERERETGSDTHMAHAETLQICINARGEDRCTH